MFCWRFILPFLLSTIFIIGCKKDDDPSYTEVETQNEPGLAILFIGNSHTNFNGGIDKQLNNFAQSVNLPSSAVKMAPNGFTLENHLNSEASLEVLNSQSWDYIILQENTFRAAYETDAMLESVSQFSELLQLSNATIYLFRTWAYNGEPEMNMLLDASYSQASSLSGYSVISVGSYWNSFIDTYQINPYSGDSVHPNEIGTYLSAGIFFKRIFNYSDLQDIPYNSILNPDTAGVIKTFITNQSI